MTLRSICLYVLLLAVLLPTTLWSQGTLKGQVVDFTDGNPIEGATVFVVGTYNGAYTDANGNYEIKDIKKGDYSVRITYIGFAEKLQTGITIRKGETTTVDFTLKSQDMTTETVEIVGQEMIIDLEDGQSKMSISADDIKDMNVTDVQDVVAMQAGVSKTPDGLQIRGGRVYETQYLVDGVSAQDPLSGTGFGVDVGSNAIKSLDVITGGSGAEYAGGTAGVIAAEIQEGSKEFHVAGQYMRDNLGFDPHWTPGWNTDHAMLSVSGPLLPFLKGKNRKAKESTGGEKDASKYYIPWNERLFFFVSGSMKLTDTYFGVYADQLNSSLLNDQGLNNFLAPRQDNKWSGTAKLTYHIKPGTKLTVSSQQSMAINQNTRMLQIVGNDEIMVPGLQWRFAEQPDNANTYTHRNNLTVLNLRTTLTDRWTMKLTAGRLFTNLRADANGRPFRDDFPGQVYSPFSITTDPVEVYEPNDSVVFTLPGNGFVNNGGIATLWHDHYAQEYTGKATFYFKPKSEVHYMNMGWEHREQEYQWIDVSSPWIGAPITLNDSTTFSSNRVGLSNEIWKARPATGGIFFSDNIRFKGIIATLGVRFSYWSMGQSADEAVQNPESPVVDQVRADYNNDNVRLGNRSWKARILPKVRVSFPITSNNVLYFNYNHALRHPHPRFVYAGLDPVYQDQSFLSFLGNPNLNPEATVSYEVGLKSKITKNSAIQITAFYNDKFDFIVSRRVTVADQTGRLVEKRMYINQDYARIRGVEVQYFQRLGKWFDGSVSFAYQQATGKSNTAAESALQIVNTGAVELTQEQFLAWDRPLDIKANIVFKTDTLTRKAFRNIRAFLSATYKSGLRYTPFQQNGIDDLTGRPIYERQDDDPFSEVGTPWFWVDLRITRDFYLNRKRTSYVGVYVECQNLFNTDNAAIINGVTGDAYYAGDPLPFDDRDPRYPSPLDSGTPPDNPARFLQPRQLLFGVNFNF